MDEVHSSQNSIKDSVVEQNARLDDINNQHSLNDMIEKIQTYHTKLTNIRRGMLMIKDNTAKLRKRANKIFDDHQEEIIANQRSRNRMAMLEKHLEPVVNTRGDR